MYIGKPSGFGGFFCCLCPLLERVYFLVGQCGDRLNGISESLKIFATCHNTQKIWSMRMVDDTAVVELSGVYSAIVAYCSLTKLMSYGNSVWDAGRKPLGKRCLAHEFKGLLGHGAREVRAIVEDPKKPRVGLGRHRLGALCYFGYGDAEIRPYFAK